MSGNGNARLLLGCYRALILAVLVGVGGVLWANVRSGIRLEERVIALTDRIDRSEREVDRRLSGLEERRRWP